ncbi:peroxidase, putative [Rhizoctonia solani AG-3 Rhs1AP]|uniref:Peroxidase, putative n=1 Tax=Rhizoctonia solani AG-3 Rhs1AP TaxID=1086054 RepID=X8J3L2_9AGAM|nr:peroxidase, putative [Rhizoctonia solani AG-3 Rhs1AP]
MRVTFLTVSCALFGASLAFPTNSGSDTGCPFAGRSSHGQTKRQIGFDPVKQKIDVSGEHAFRAPGPNDKRGPCAGLNAMANHGYISRNGVTTIQEAILASNKVFGLGKQAVTIFSNQAAFYGGDMTTGVWSIGGPESGPGLSYTHNQMEGDASPTRNDAYMNNGDASTLSMDYFKRLYDLVPEGESANFDMSVMAKHRAWTRQHSISTNPNYFTAPYAGLFVSTLTHILSPALLSNHSAEHPNGILGHNVLKSFYSVTGDSNSLTYQPGHERIPDNWYRRADDYDLALISLDFDKLALEHPEFFSFGGNTGKPNSFAGANVDDLTGGVFNAKNLLNGKTLMCFAFQAFQAGMSAAASKLFSETISPVISSLGCPVMKQYNTTALGMYPGA